MHVFDKHFSTIGSRAPDISSTNFCNSAAARSSDGIAGRASTME
jgi:hypothetical protein